ncbi:MAG: hypothetical protein FWC26_11150 [Fibromonadales bacterium]|nr:hypothetical protein [Fibromonadales bacterium]
MTKNQLENFTLFVNVGDTFFGQYIKLGADIVLNDTNSQSGWRNWDSTTTGLEQWTPIGNSNNYFQGNFDGNGKKIIGLYINNFADLQGLFGRIGSEGSISNLGVTGFYVKGGGIVGGVAGYGNVTNSYAIGNVSGTSNVGGVAGYGNVTNSYAVGNVSGDNRVGGVVGNNTSGTVSNSYVVGNVSGTNYVGGVAGSGNVTNSYAVGSVSGINYVGGVTGSGTVSYSYYNSDSATASNLNQLGSPKATTEMQTSAFRDTLQIYASVSNAINVDNNFMGWIYNTNGYPSLSSTKAPSIVTANYFASGTGTSANPYIITTKNQLENFALFVNIGNGFSGQYIKLGADIVLNDTNTQYGWKNWDSTTTGLKQWTPIGTSNNYFQGSFDGSSKSIIGLYISRTSNYQGLFGASSGSISNLGLVGFYVNGGSYVGGVVGYNNGDTVANSYAVGNVSGTSSVGGVVGYNNWGTIVNSYAVGKVSGTSSAGGAVGGNSGTVSNSYYNSDLATIVTTTNGTPKTTSQMQTVAFRDTLQNYASVLNAISTDNNFMGWTYNANGYPSLSSTKAPPVVVAGYFESGSGTSADPYIIMTKSQLENFAFFVNAGNSFSDQYIKLGTDIVLIDTTLAGGWRNWNSTSGLEQWIPIGNSRNYFQGSFDGGGKAIIGLYISRTSNYQGLFGYTGGNISNLGVVGFYVKGGNQVGGVVGINEGIISNSYAIGNVSGSSEVGGVVGSNYDVFTLAGVADSNYGTIANSYAVGNVSGNGRVGGVVGGSYGGTVANSYAIGNVSGGSDVGGVAGYGNVTNSYYNSDSATANYLNELGIPKTTAEMQAVAFCDTLQRNARIFNSVSNDFMDWTYNANAYPSLSSTKAPPLAAFESGSGTLADPYVIMTKGQLENFAFIVNAGNNFSSQYIKLGADIVLNDTTLSGGWRNWSSATTGLEQWTPIYRFKGNFNGNGKVVIGLYINSARDNQGLFGRSEGNISNLGLAGFYVKGGYQVGGVVGWNEGTVSNSYAIGNVLGSGCVIGGITGYNTYFGTIANSYLIGVWNDDGYYGYLCNDGTAVNSYYNSDSTTVHIEGLAKTTAEMKTQSTYENWDFESIWAMFANINDGYPIFQIDIKNAEIATAQSSYTYTGNSIEPEVTATYRGSALTKNTHYTLSYSNNTYVGTATVTVKGKGGYFDSNSINFTISPTTDELQFPKTDTITVTFSDTLTIADIPLPNNSYNWANSTTKIDSAGHGQKFDAEYTDSNYVNKAIGKIIVNVDRANGTGEVGIENWTYNDSAKTPWAESETNNKDNVVYYYEGRDETDYPENTEKPENAGDYTLTGIFPENRDYNSFHATADFTILKAAGDCKVSMADFISSAANISSPVDNSETNGTTNVTYLYIGDGWNSDNKPSNPGEYKIKATFATTPNYLACIDSATFHIYANWNLIAIPKGSALAYTGEPQTGVAEIAAYTVTGDYKATNVGEYTATVSPKSNYIWLEDSSREDKEIIWSIKKATGIFQTLPAQEATYSTTLALQNISLQANYEWKNPETPVTSAGQGQQFPAIYTDPSGNYEPAEGTVTINVAKATGTFEDTSITAKYTSTLKLKNINLTNNYKWENDATPLTKIGDSSYAATYTDPSGNYKSATGNINVEVVKGDGTCSVEIAGWTYEETAKTPSASSATNNDVTPSFHYNSSEQPKEVGEYTITAIFPYNGYYNPCTTSYGFTIDRAKGTGTVTMDDWTFGAKTIPSPVTVSKTNGQTNDYLFWSIIGPPYSSNSMPSNVGTYVVEAKFPQTGNYYAFTERDTFEIKPITVQVTWSDTVFTYNGTPQSPKPFAEGYNLTADAQTNAGSHTATATTQSAGVVLVPATRPYTIKPKELKVTWTGKREFTYNKMNQSPTPSINKSELHGPLDFIFGGYGYAADDYTGSKAAYYIINPEDPNADNYRLDSNRAEFKINKKDLSPKFQTTLPDFAYKNDTLRVPTEVFQDTAALQQILDSIVAYEGFATDTVKKETDDAKVLKGKAKVKIDYDDQDGNSQGSKSFLAKRVETTQKATATIITDAVSADNYKPLDRSITIMEMGDDDEGGPATFCKREEKCIALNAEICDFLDGKVVSKCDETPILHHVPYPMSHVPKYYTLKGTLLGTAKPTTPGIYIEVTSVRAEKFQPQQRAKKIIIK